MIELTEEQEELIKQLVHAFRTGVGGEEGPTWEEFDRDRERIDHNTSSPDCWCEPEIEELDNGNLLVIHRDKSEAN